MHETMVAQSLLAAISSEAAKQNATPVCAKISCGAFDAINDETLCFAFEVVGRGTICEGMKLEIEHKPIQARCKNCQEAFEFELSSPTCPKCGGDFEVLPSEPLMLETIEFETE